jgi:O-antigen biosynthesis protein
MKERTAAGAANLSATRRPILAASLIVCSRNRAVMLRDAVASILEGDALPAELLVIDQSDSPDSRFDRWEAPDGCEIRYLFSSTRGLSRANNVGAAEASHETLVFTHDDVRADPAWLGSIVTTLNSAPEMSVVTGRILASSEGGTGGYAPTLQPRDSPALYRGRLGYDVLKPLNMAMRRDDLRAMGGFDERLGPGTPYPGAEDADLGFRLLEGGYGIIYAPDALVYHRAWRREAEYLPLRWRYGVAQGAFYAKHARLRDPHIPLRVAKDVGRRLRRFPRRLLREPRRSLGDPLFVAGTLAGAIRWYSDRLVGFRGSPSSS